MRVKRKKGPMAILAVAVIAMGILAAAATESASSPATGSARLVSIQEFPTVEMCTWEDPAGANPNLIASLQQEDLFAALQQQWTLALTSEARADSRNPVRTIRDLHPTYSAIADESYRPRLTPYKIQKIHP